MAHPSILIFNPLMALYYLKNDKISDEKINWAFAMFDVDGDGEILK